MGQPGAEPLLTEAGQVDAFFADRGPEYVFVAAGKSGGIEANRKYPADLLLDNLLVTCHLLQSACRHRVKKLLYLASSCVYPRDCPQPMRVESSPDGAFRADQRGVCDGENGRDQTVPGVPATVRRSRLSWGFPPTPSVPETTSVWNSHTSSPP